MICPTTVLQAIDFFDSDETDTKLRGNVKLQANLRLIEEHGCTHGFSGELIEIIINIAGSGRFAESTNKRLIKAAIPNGTIPETAVIQAISWMCTNKPSIGVQSTLMRWIILIFQYLEGTKKIHTIYGMIFYFLESETLCPQVCHLLYLLTQKEDVKFFRVRQILTLQQKMGSRPYLIGLLSIYKMYAPNLVAMVLPSTRKVYFQQTNKAWAADIAKVREGIIADVNEEISIPNLNKTVQKSQNISISASKAKRAKMDIIPQSTMSCEVQIEKKSTLPGHKSSVPFNHIKSFNHLLKMLDRIELPCQLAAAMKSVHLQHIISLNPDHVTISRLSHWVAWTLHEEFLFGSQKQTPVKEDLLNAVIQFTDFMQEMLPVVEKFLIRFFESWNGTLYRPQILRLLSRIRLKPFNSLYADFFEHLRKLYFSSSVFVKCQILVCLTNLLHNYASIELPRSVAIWDKTEEGQEHYYSVYSEVVPPFVTEDMFTDFIKFVNEISVIGLHQENNDLVLISTILDFQTVVSSMYTVYHIPVITLPHPGIIFQAFFSWDAVCLGNLLEIFNRICNSYKYIREASEISSPICKGLETISTYNSYLLVICDMLWRNRLFKHEKKVANILHVPNEIVTKMKISGVSNALSLMRHPAMMAHTANFVEDNPSCVMRNIPVFDTDSQVKYLDFLTESGFPSIVTFMYLFSKRLSSTSK